MPYFPDLADTGPVKHVGYLWSGHRYPRGNVSAEFFDQLVELVEQPLAVCCGHHSCNLGWCGMRLDPETQQELRYQGRVVPLSSWDILVPGDTHINWPSRR